MPNTRANVANYNANWKRLPNEGNKIVIRVTIPDKNADNGESDSGKSIKVSLISDTILPERLGFTFQVYRPYSKMNPRYSNNSSISIAGNVVTIRVNDPTHVMRENKKSITIAHLQHKCRNEVIQCSFFFRK